jgi:hypothetical protein
MYRYYRTLPEFNRSCIKAARDRAYQQHVSALKDMRPSVDTTRPQCPQVIGRNYKRYVNDQERNELIVRDNKRLLGKMGDIQRQEHYPIAVPKRPFTLLGQAQKDEMARITHENRKMLVALQERRPTLNRNDWMVLRLDHEYQIQKMSEYTRTRPMGDIIRAERARLGLDAAPTPSRPRAQSVAQGTKPATKPETPGQKWQFATAGGGVPRGKGKPGDPKLRDVIKDTVDGAPRPADQTPLVEGDMIRDAVDGDAPEE